MKRLAFTLITAILAAGPFNQKLTPDQQIIHALNRLTFGPRPGDMEQVRRIGLNKWIEQQLHPEQIAENPELEAKLKPLATLQMPVARVVEEYTPRQQEAMRAFGGNVSLNSLLPNDQIRKVMNGTAEERTEVLNSLDPDKRKQVLAMVPPTVIEYTPVYKEEANEARNMRQEEIQKEQRRRNPQLNDLLTLDDVRIARSGSNDQLAALLARLDPETRAQIASQLPPPRLAEFPDLRREAELRRTPRLVASEDLKEAKLYRAIYSNR